MINDKMNPANIDEYISTFPEAVRIKLERLRQTIREAAPGAEEAISYKIPTFKMNGNLVHFAAFKKHIGFYPEPSGIEAFKEELTKYESAAGSVKFPIDEDLPLDLIRRIVKYRVKENQLK